VRRFLAARLRAFRTERGLTQRVLGSRASVSPTFIGEVERGEKSVSFDNLYRLAGALRVPMRFLTDVPPGRARGATSAEAHRLVALILAGSRENSQKAYDVVRGILGARAGAVRRPRRYRQRP
jgi:transcriptional regulator with XRE-family HTH domain